ncbi:long-chain-fatty-acid-CoA ligase [Cylindrobasidium torrendii FP15055 ss-10]|uniref:Long-chain-fatty-acid-CoA ligase n=1 Tax=Cylindrobasidium torrendii FP15055 ss-10 TaxID=1314674 RepID=A0A0D7BQ33_9AGAR|nr:long-chain-fatty-acid-CoA ligase [Cylindrobasidium torrendii FP15055 ss-10]
MSNSPLYSLKEAQDIVCAPGTLLEIEKRLIDGRVVKVWKNAWPSMRAFWVWARSEHKDKTAIVFEDTHYTYVSAFLASMKCASILREKYQVKKGDRVAICSRNYASYFIVFWGCHLIGAVSVLVNAHLPYDALLHCLVLTSPKVTFLDPQRADIFESTAFSKGSSLVVIEAHEGKGHWENMDDFSQLMQQCSEVDAAKVLAEDPNIQPDDNATIIFTSGTTGLPKGVLSTQRAVVGIVFNVMSNIARAAIRWGGAFPPPPPPPDAPQKASLMPTPMFHTTARLIDSMQMAGTFAGHRIVSLRKWSIDEAVRICQEENVTQIGAVPTVMADIAERAELEGFSSLEVLIYGGAPVPEVMYDRAKNVFSKALIGQGYGLTETNAGIIGFAGPDFEQRPLSCGCELPTHEMMIMKGDVEAPRNVIGEIWLRGTSIMKEYWNDPETTAKTLTKDGWLKTGDLGYICKDGFLYITDRIKDIIIRGGENIPSVTVENALYTQPELQEVAVVGVPDLRLGELVVAVVNSKRGAGGTITEGKLIALCKKRLPRYAVPVMVILDQIKLERTETGKVIKTGLRGIANEYWLKRKGDEAMTESKL